MEDEIVGALRKSYGRDLVSAIVVGSYAYYEQVPGISDYDMQVFLRHFSPQRSCADLAAISRRYGVELSLSTKNYEDLKNRIRNDRRATRFVSNLNLIDFKLKARLLAGRDVRKDIPPVSELLRRDLGADLRELYLKMTSTDPVWNLSLKGPGQWSHSMINLSYALALSKGVAPKKNRLAQALMRTHPAFAGTSCLKSALRLRGTGKIRRLNAKEKTAFRKQYDRFLGAYRKHVFF